MYDCVFVTHQPAFYRVNLYNKLAKDISIFVIFLGASSNIREQSFLLDKCDFEHSYAFIGPWEKKGVKGLFEIIKLITWKLRFRRIVVEGWDTFDFWMINALTPRKKLGLVLESTSLESTHLGVRGLLKRFFLSRLSFVLPCGKLHSDLLRLLRFKGREFRTSGVGISGIEPEDQFCGEPQKLAPVNRSLIFVGRLAEEKNLFPLLEAMSRLPQFKLGIFGTGPLLQDLKEIAPNNVYFYGHKPREQMSEIFKSFDALILPSKSETWGLVVEEALFMGLPVIVSRSVGCWPELVDSYNTGIVLEAADADGIAAGIRLMMRPEKYSYFKQNIKSLLASDLQSKQLKSYLDALAVD